MLHVQEHDNTAYFNIDHSMYKVFLIIALSWYLAETKIFFNIPWHMVKKDGINIVHVLLWILKHTYLYLQDTPRAFKEIESNISKKC